MRLPTAPLAEPSDRRRAERPPLPHVEAGTCLLIVSIIIVLLPGVLLLRVGAGDLSIAGLFSTDEKLAGQLVQAMILRGDLGLSHFFSYGPLDLYLGRALLWPYSLVRPVDGQAILIALRIVSLAAGAGSVVVTYLLGRKIWNAWTGGLAALFLASSATLLQWSTTAHPDTVQLFWLLLGLLATSALASHPSRRMICFAAASAGLAFTAKYGGAFLLPPLCLAVVLGRLNVAGPASHVSRVCLILLDVACSVLVFCICFVVIDPGAILEPQRFIYQMTLEAGLAHKGHLLLLDPDAIAWVRLFSRQEVLGPLMVVVALPSLVGWTAADIAALATDHLPSRRHDPAPGAGAMDRRSTRRAAAAIRLPLELWTLGLLIFLMLWVAELESRYVLPVLPGLALVGSASLVRLAGSSRRRSAGALGLAILIVALPFGRLLAYQSAQTARVQDPSTLQRIAAGKWLAEHLSSSTRILADAYTYIPPSFTTTDESFGLTHEQIRADRPKIIVTDSSIRDRYADPSAAARYADGPGAYAEIAATYRDLDTGALRCYPLLQRFGPTAIFGVAQGQPSPGGC